jgi:CRISPR/Cas system CSM-associated protein Csm2 small subunit
MSQEDTTATTEEAPEASATTDADAPAQEAPASPKTYSEAEVKALRSEAAKYRTRLRDLEAAEAKREEQGKSELEKAQAKLAKAESQLAEQNARSLRLQVALDKKIPTELIDRLKGDSLEELTEDAETLQKLIGTSDDSADLDGGAREPAEPNLPPEQAHQRDLLAKLGLAPKST